MSANSKIEWTDHTFNIAWGCVKASAGCDHCYADTLSSRYGFNLWGPGRQRRVMSEKYWQQPFAWNAAAERQGRRAKVFCSSMTDVFLNDETINRERVKLWPVIEATPALDWLLLTKHPERFRYARPNTDYPNVWLGVSVEDNSAAWRVDLLRHTSAAVRFLSVEPMLGPVDKVSLEGIHWVICGGESGPKARPMELDWARDLRDRCVSENIPFFLKQLGGVRDKRGGEDALLDGRRWTQFPKEATPLFGAA